MKKSMDKKFVGLTSLLFIIIFLLLVLTITALYGSGKSPLYDAARTLIRAKEELVPSADKSLLFCFPLQQISDGKSRVNITVFVRSASEKNLSNQRVDLATTVGNIQSSSGITDKEGKISFALTSLTPGKAGITATVLSSVKLASRCEINFQ